MLTYTIWYVEMSLDIINHDYWLDLKLADEGDMDMLKSCVLQINECCKHCDLDLLFSTGEHYGIWSSCFTQMSEDSQGELIVVYQWSVVRRWSTLLETTGPIEVWFYMEHLCLTGTKVYIIGPGHMTKMAAMPIYGKTLNFLQNYVRGPWNLAHRKGRALRNFNDPRFTLTYFTRSTLFI